MVEKFEHRLLKGVIKVSCKYDDGSVRHWQTKKEIVVAQIREIVDSYAQKGYTLTLRQLHYQFVSHDVIAGEKTNYVNHDSAYKKLGSILDDCRYGGVIDWDAIEDRGRKPRLPYSVADVDDALEDSIQTYRLDRQRNQKNHVEVWTEKDALSGIMSRTTDKYHVRLVVNKGYTSSSAIYNSYERVLDAIRFKQNVVVLYFGDHDPSGLDMIRDVEQRLKFMMKNGREVFQLDKVHEYLKVIPIGLTKQQVRQYKLPPNPTKMTDTRSKGYIKEHGKTCWEVDALNPETLTSILESNILKHIDEKKYKSMLSQEVKDKKELRSFIDSRK